jgi:hypothetical protein
MEHDAERELWKATYRNWGLTAKFIPLPILKRRLLARWPHLDPGPVLRNIEARMQQLVVEHRARQQWR